MLARSEFLKQISFLLFGLVLCLVFWFLVFFERVLVLVVALIAFHKNYVAIRFTLGSEHKVCSSFWKPPKLWLHFCSLITSPRAPFISSRSWKRVIGLEAVLTCLAGWRSGPPLSHHDARFLPSSRAGRATAHGPSDGPRQTLAGVLTTRAFWTRPVKWTHWVTGTWCFPNGGWEGGLWACSPSRGSHT